MGCLRHSYHSIRHGEQGAENCLSCLGAFIAHTGLIVSDAIYFVYSFGISVAKRVRLTLAKALARANLRRAESGEKALTMNSLAIAAGVAATTITRLARDDQKAAAALSLDLAGKLVTVLNCGIEDLLEVIED